MARAALDLGVGELAALASVSPDAVSHFEAGDAPTGTVVDDLRAALCAAGITFLDAGDVASGAGVCLHIPDAAAIDVDERQVVQYPENLENDAPPGAGG